MIAPNEFWLQLHRLAEAYDAEGLTRQERTENILAQFRNMPHVARRAIIADLMQVAVNIPDLYPLVVAAAIKAESPKKVKPTEDVA
jgi:hypothetical protein